MGNVTRSPERAIADLPAVARRARVEAAAARRTRDRHRRAVEAGEASLATALGAWSRRGDVLRIDTASGATYAGPITLVGRDAIAVGATLVRFSAVVAVHASPGDPPRGGADAAPDGPTFAALVASLAATRPLVRLGRPFGLAPIEAELRSAGDDMIVARTPGSSGEAVIPIGQVSELTVLASG